MASAHCQGRSGSGQFKRTGLKIMLLYPSTYELWTVNFLADRICVSATLQQIVEHFKLEKLDTKNF
jgi:hypothetical protein